MSDTEGPQFDPRPENGDPSEWVERNTSAARWPILAVAVLLIGGALGYYFFQRSHQSGEPAAESAAGGPPPTTAPKSIRPSGPETEANLPTLDSSDDWVRMHAADLTTRPLFAKALAGKDLIRRFVVSVLNAAEGVSPRKHLPRIAPASSFTPDMIDGQPTLGPTSYRRYDSLARTIDSIDAEAAARLYRLARPLLNQAYRDLGFPDESFDAAVARALHRVQTTPAVSGPIELQKAVASYKFVDPSLESLSDLQKQLLRMGPRNRGLIEKKFAAVVRRLGLEDALR
jgi:hypothetical protein